MTHFVTLAYLQAFVPHLVLLLAALLQQHGAPHRVTRAVVVGAMLTQALTWPAPHDELFSRQLVHDRFAATALVVICGVASWRKSTDLLACFVATCLAATNDLLSLFVLWAVLCQARNEPRVWLSWAVMATLMADGVRQMRVTEFATLTQMSAPVLWAACFALVAVVLLASRPRWVELVGLALPATRLALLTLPLDTTNAWVLR